jgi:hypothetical protein
MSAASASTPSRLEAARRRAEDAKVALATGAVVLFAGTGVAVAATHPGNRKDSAMVQQQSEDSTETDDLTGGTLAPATSQPQASTSLS